MADHLGHEPALAALDMAIAQQRPAPGLLHHADRGVQYAAHSYRARLLAHGMLCSMSRKGDCWDNAPMESFFATLKGELVEGADYQTRDEAKADVFQYTRASIIDAACTPRSAISHPSRRQQRSIQRHQPRNRVRESGGKPRRVRFSVR